jgi:hypothetical protein
MGIGGRAVAGAEGLGVGAGGKGVGCEPPWAKADSETPRMKVSRTSRPFLIFPSLMINPSRISATGVLGYEKTPLRPHYE